MATVFDSIEVQAKASIERPDSYFTSRFEDEHPEFGRSGFSTHRDADVTNRSNWKAIQEIIKEKYPDTDWKIIGSNHWAVGWCEELLVRVLINPDLEYDELFDEDNITPIFKELMDIMHELTCQYPILNESIYYEMEYQEILENIQWQLPNWSTTDAEPSEIYTWLRDRDYEPDNYSFKDREVELACFKMGHTDSDYQEEVDEWASRNADLITSAG